MDSSNSNGYRALKSAHQAIEAVQENDKGATNVFSCKTPITQYFKVRRVNLHRQFVPERT